MKIAIIGLLILSILLFSAGIMTSQSPKGIQISPDTFKVSFGKEHPFKLTVHGPSPVFTRAGYTFKVETGGHELYDPLYYDVPVYIDVDEDYHTGEYRLYTTKETKVSVGISILAGPGKHVPEKQLGSKDRPWYT